MTPICLQCGRKRPPGRTESWCVPCSNVGHNYRLCESFDDAVRSYQMWTAYWDRHEFSSTSRLEIPMFQNLLDILFWGL